MAKSYKVGVFDISTEGQPDFDVVCECRWRSTGWADVEDAKARATQHADEHRTGKPAQELVDFREARGIGVKTPDVSGAVHVIDSSAEQADEDGAQA